MSCNFQIVNHAKWAQNITDSSPDNWEWLSLITYRLRFAFGHDFFQKKISVLLVAKILRVLLDKFPTRSFLKFGRWISHQNPILCCLSPWFYHFRTNCFRTKGEGQINFRFISSIWFPFVTYPQIWTEFLPAFTRFVKECDNLFSFIFCSKRLFQLAGCREEFGDIEASGLHAKVTLTAGTTREIRIERQLEQKSEPQNTNENQKRYRNLIQITFSHILFRCNIEFVFLLAFKTRAA